MYCAKEFNPNFHYSWISFTWFVRNLRPNFSESSEIQTFSPLKNRWSPTKKKKGSSPKLSLIFRPKSEVQTIFQPKNKWSPKQKKGLHRNWVWFLGQNRKFRHFFTPNHDIYITTSAPSFLWGDCFQFFIKNRPKKQQKRAILHTSQANGGLEPPPWLRYWFGSMLKKNNFFSY